MFSTESSKVNSKDNPTYLDSIITKRPINIKAKFVKI